MKILLLVPYMHIDEYPGLERFNVGASYTFYSIADELGKEHQVYVYVQCGKYESCKVGNFELIGKSYSNVLTPSFPYIKAWFTALKSEHKINLNRALHYAYYYFAGNHIEKIIKEIKPDIVNIRSGDFSTIACILACERLHVKFIVSCHGLSFTVNNDSIRPSVKELDKSLYRYCEKKLIPMTVISSGMKKRVIKSLGLKGNNIFVVPNGVDKRKVEPSNYSMIELKKSLRISENDFIIISAGTIGARKNQIQIVKAYGLLSEHERNRIKVLILGSGSEADIEKLKDEIANIKGPNGIIYCGFIPINKIDLYYKISNANVIASIDEGFGRAFIEGFITGIPSITFSDLDAVDDLYNEKVMIKVQNRTDHALAEGIRKAYYTQWDSEYIKKYAESFSVKKMADNYMKIFEMHINGYLIED